METTATEASANVAGSTATKATTPVNGATDPNSNSQVLDKGEFSEPNGGDRSARHARRNMHCVCIYSKLHSLWIFGFQLCHTVRSKE
jgi:hypothetical protein